MTSTGQLRQSHLCGLLVTGTEPAAVANLLHHAGADAETGGNLCTPASPFDSATQIAVSVVASEPRALSLSPRENGTDRSLNHAVF